MLIPPGESLPTPPPQPPATAHAHLDSSGPRAVPISASHTMTPCRSHFSHLQPAFQGGVPRRPPPALASLCLASLFGKTERKCLPWRFLRGFREPVSGKDLEHSLAHSTRSVAVAASRKPRAPPAAPPRALVCSEVGRQAFPRKASCKDIAWAPEPLSCCMEMRSVF